MEIDEMFKELNEKLNSADDIALIFGLITKENTLRLITHGNGKKVLCIIADLINQISSDTGVPAAAICADLFQAAITLEESEHE